MLQQAQQYALAQGLGAKSELAVDEALTALDPLVRALVRRRIRRLLRRVELDTASTDTAHRLALAYVYGARRVVTDPENVELVAREAAASPPPPSLGRTGPWLSLGGAILVALLATATSWWHHARRPFSPLETPAGELLGKVLADHTVAVSRRDSAHVASARATLTSAAATQALGSESVQRLAAVLHSVEALPGAEAERTQRVDAFQNAVAGLDRALFAARLPYFVDAEVLFSPAPQALPMSYYVQREARAKVDGKEHRVVRLWRLDDIAISQGLLGFTRPHTPAAIVLLDQIEADLVRFTLPAAAPLGQVELLDEETREKGEPWASELEGRATKAMAAHYRAVGGQLGKDAIRIGTLLSRRRELVRKWSRLLRGQGFELRAPTDLFPPESYSQQLELRVPRADLNDWQDLHAELRERLPSFEALRDRFVQGVERHEVQHRIDYERGLMPVPPLLCRIMGLDNPLDAPYGSLPARARDEASAFLAEVARPGDSPLLDVVILAHFMLDKQQLGGAYSYAALEVYGALAQALGMDVERALAVISRERFARLAAAIWERSPSELREAAHKAYLTEFGVALSDVTFHAVSENPRYRPER